MSVPTRRTPYNSHTSSPIYDFELPFDPNGLRRNAMARGFSREEADVFAHLALMKLREAMANKTDGEPVTALEVAQAIKQHAIDEVEKNKAKQQDILEKGVNLVEDMDEEELDDFLEPDEAYDDEIDLQVAEEESMERTTKRFKFSDDGLEEYFGMDEDPYGISKNMDGLSLSLKHHGMDLITAICQRLELAVELAKHLRPEDILKLYSISKSFHDALDGHLLSSVRQVIAYAAPESGRVFSFRLYRRHLVPDPAGRTWAEQSDPRIVRMYGYTMQQVRTVPGIKYLQLVLVRDRCCREIVAMMARNGHRTPPGMFETLLRMWLLMDIPTSLQRRSMLRNKALWPDVDLYNAQLFIVKLGMHFNDPVFGPLTYDIPNIIFGFRGLYFLWQVLMRKKFTCAEEILDAKVRYDWDIRADHWGDDFFESDVFGVPFRLVGRGHTEGWGTGRDHLLRPDELIPIEAVVRGLHLDEHLVHMMTWGFFDWETGENLVPSEEEMYISDEEEALAHMDTGGHWQRKHTLKKRWATLTAEQQRKIRADDADDQLRALAWAAEHPTGINGIDDDYNGERIPTLDDDINRGFIVRPPERRDDKETRLAAPPPHARENWAAFANQALRGVPPEVHGDEALRALAFHNYYARDVDADWDWEAWLEQEEDDRAAAGKAPLSDVEEEDGSEDTLVPGQDDDEYDTESGKDPYDEEDEDEDGEDEDGGEGDEDEEMWDEETLESYIDDFFEHILVEGVE